MYDKCFSLLTVNTLPLFDVYRRHNVRYNTMTKGLHGAPELLLAFGQLGSASLQQPIRHGEGVVAVEVKLYMRFLGGTRVELIAELLRVYGDPVDIKGEVQNLTAITRQAKVLFSPEGAAHEPDELIGIFHHEVDDDSAARRRVLYLGAVRAKGVTTRYGGESRAKGDGVIYHW